LGVFKVEDGFATSLALEALLAVGDAERKRMGASEPAKVIDEIVDFGVAHILKG
jgi:hypothetical protein